MSGARAVDVAQDLVRRLRALGAEQAVLAPGSRSGPLAVALHAADAAGIVRLHVRVDEREAAFLALGLAKASGRPVPVVTTSGTAVANLHPAMLEALHARVPLLAVTADRPARLRGTGANQTTDQRRIFPGVAFIDHVEALEPGSGPIHLNLELDEPLLAPQAWDFGASGPAAVPAGPAPAAPVAVDPTRTVVVAGDGSPAPPPGLPLVAEPSSGVRTGDALTAGRLVVAHSPLARQVERVVSLGHATLTRPVTRLLARTDVEVVHVGDPTTFPVPAGPNVRFVDAVELAGSPDPAWLAAWQDADARASAVVREHLDGATPLDVARTVWDAVGGGLLVVGSSSPIRDLDLVAPPAGDGRTVLANRGLAGIDGTLSTAIGAALALPGRPALAVVGDLTFLHGANGLLIGPHEPRPDLTIIVVNDDGGAIFGTLEQGGPEFADAFERVFATPTGTDLAALCRAHGVDHERVESCALADALRARPRGVSVVEVPVERLDRRALGARIEAGVRDLFSR